MRTGADYISSIRRDGRRVLLDGDPITDVTTHPGFSGPIQILASLYDLACELPGLRFHEDGATHSSMWLVPHAADDLKQRLAIHRHWSEGSYGLMGRTPDHGAALMSAFAGRRDIFDRGGQRFGNNVVAFYEQARANDWFVSYAIIPPQVDRSKAAHDQPEPFLYPGIVEENDDGIVIRGAQMVGTSAAIADYLFLSCIVPLQPGDEDYAISVVMPLTAAGLRIYPRRPYASATTSRFDYPLTARFDESDSLIVLRDVHVPWEHTFVHRDVKLVNAQFYETGAHVLANYQALIQFLVKLEFASGLAISLVDAHGMSSIPPVQAQLGGEIASLCAAIEAMVLAAEVEAVRYGELLIPAPKYIYSAMSLQRRWVVDFMRALRELGGGGLIALPSSEKSFTAPETADDVERYYRSATMPARDRVALLKLLWDLVGSEFGGRQLQFEMFNSAAQHVANLRAFHAYDWDIGREHVRRCMEDS